MRERQASAIVVSPLRGVPPSKLISIFKQAFKGHPASLLHDELTLAFLRAFAESATFLVARNAATGAELGFAVGGDAEVLDRTRSRFIRTYGWRLAGHFLARRLSVRTLFARIGVRRQLRAVPNAPYQLRFVVVDPQARGSGIGTTLIAAFERTLPAGSAYHAWTLEGARGAEKFYLANGFTPGPNVNGHIRMWKRLDEESRACGALE